MPTARNTQVDVSYSTAYGTATTADQGNIAATGTVSFAPNETSKTIDVSVRGDSTIEPDETLTFTLTTVSSNAPLGAALAAQRTVIELATTEDPPAASAKIEDRAYMPLLNLAGIYNLDSNVALVADTNWISTSDDDHFDATLMFSYQFDRHWDAGFGYGEYRRRTDTADLFNSVKYNVVLLNVGYTF